jgi:hypothetical protein
LSLWLISLTPYKALSFIDHKLKVGNSIIGTDRKHIEVKGKGLFDSVSYNELMNPVLKKYLKLKEIGSETIDAVQQQSNLYEEIQNDLNLVKKKFDYYLASQYSGGIDNKEEYVTILRSNEVSTFESDEIKPLMKLATEKQFFHWELEFPEVFQQGGFDVAIGNPPYVEVNQAQYNSMGYTTLIAKNLYAYMVEKNISNLNDKGYYGTIIPLNSIASSRMATLQKIIKERKQVYISNFAIRPSKIFKKVDQRVSIITGRQADNKNTSSEIYTTGYVRWHSKDRKKIFSNIRHTRLSEHNSMTTVIPKIGTKIENDILSKVLSVKNKISDYISEDSSNYIYYHSAARYWIKALNFIPDFNHDSGSRKQSSKYKQICLQEGVNPNVLIALINSSLFYWYWIVTSDCRDVTTENILNFNADLDQIPAGLSSQLDFLVKELMTSYQENSSSKTCNLASVGQITYQEFYPKRSKGILDKIDQIFAKQYKFTSEELCFLTSFQLTFRMGEA